MKGIRGLVLGLLCLIPAQAGADIAFPAQLRLEEREAGLYDVTFTLPLVQGRKLRAQPSFPPTCGQHDPPEVTASGSSHTSTWSVRCEPASLAGEAILIEGLLGTQTELAFTFTTLDGRVFSKILRPSRPGFLVPEPPTSIDLAGDAAARGIRRTLRELPLWWLLLVAALTGLARRELAVAAAAFAIGHASGQWLGGEGLLQLSVSARDVFVLLSAIVPAAALAGAGPAWRGWLRPLAPFGLVLGLAYGGARPEALPPGGLSDAEQQLAIGFFAVGAGLAVLLMAAIGSELRAVLRNVGRESRGTELAGKVLAGIAGGMLLAVAVGLTQTPGNLANGPWGLGLASVLLGLQLGRNGAGRRMVLPVFLLLLAGGAGAGLARWPLPLGSTLGHGALLVLGLSMAAGRTLRSRMLAGVAVIAVPALGWSTVARLAETSAKAAGLGAGVAVLTLGVLWAAMAVGRESSGAPLPRSLRILGAAVVGLVVAVRLGEYATYFDRELATEAAFGRLRLPLLALVLLLVAAASWPRRHKVVRELGLETRRRSAHWLWLGAAFLLLPFGTLAVKNPFFEPHAPRGDDARRVVTSVLSNTYHAFNLADESELFDRLAENVTVEMVDDLYLDSRRRLAAGTREGAEVKVREVGVLEIGDPVDAGQLAGAYSYDCRWVVVARVRHLQHVHHRRNIYNGVLTLRVHDERWKIAHVELLSEDRVVVPWKPV